MHVKILEKKLMITLNTSILKYYILYKFLVIYEHIHRLKCPIVYK